MHEPVSIWPPVLENIASSIDESDRLVLVVSPFIRSAALEVFLDTLPHKNPKIIVRWSIKDLLAGASDLNIFNILEDRRMELYIHANIHLKLYQFESGIAYCGSSNITNKGLSLQESCNEEMGVLFPIDLDSYAHIRRVCDESRKVTKEIVDAYQKAIDESQIDPPIIGKLVLPPMEEKEFLVSELPASDNPQAFLAAASNYLQKQEMCPRMLHDVGTYKITEKDLRSEDLEEKLMQSFRNQTFVKRIVEEIRSLPSINFGAVAALVHNIAQDVPLPYRSDIKEAIARLYPWLEYCFEDLSWSIPGARSQVIKSSLFGGGGGDASQSMRRSRRQ